MLKYVLWKTKTYNNYSKSLFIGFRLCFVMWFYFLSGMTMCGRDYILTIVLMATGKGHVLHWIIPTGQALKHIVPLRRAYTWTILTYTGTMIAVLVQTTLSAKFLMVGLYILITRLIDWYLAPTLAVFHSYIVAWIFLLYIRNLQDPTIIITKLKVGQNKFN